MSVVQGVDPASHPFPLVYAERRRGFVGDERLIDEWSVLPARLAPALADAGYLVVVDPLSFPFEDLREHQWDFVLGLVWPEAHEVGLVCELLDGPVLSKLTFFDRLVVGDDAVWEHVRARYALSESQRWPAADDLETAVRAMVRSNVVAERAHTESTARRMGTLDPWSVRSAANKRAHRIELATLATLLADMTDPSVTPEPIRVAHVGVGVGRLRAAFSDTRYTGFVRGPAVIAQARANYPGSTFHQLGHDGGIDLPVESVDLVVFTHELSRISRPQRRSTIASAWRALRVGGKLAVLDSFVPGQSRPFLSADDITQDIRRSTGGGVVLTDVESMASAASPTRDVGLIVTTKIGVPKRW